VTTNRTQWPLDGGSLVFHGSHPWAFTYVNLGLGSDDTVIFNISLVHGFNQTGNGTFCFPKISVPKDISVSAGTNASLQVIQLSALGSALYNVSPSIDLSSLALPSPQTKPPKGRREEKGTRGGVQFLIV
jgi:hypothetical protein